jgi:mitochondrial import inner membrane translocase subunit TIM50
MFGRFLRSKTRSFCSVATEHVQSRTKPLFVASATVFGAALAFDFANNWSYSSKYLAIADEKFEDFLEWMVPGKPGPWLLDLETMKYPDYIPTLVMDMDKVLVHMEHDSMQGWRVVRRPGADQFLKELQHYYELVVFSDDVYPVAVDVVSKWGVPCTGVLHREFCKKTREGFIKDISKLGRRMDKIIVLDHDPIAFKRNPENSILIKPFEGDDQDRELVDLLEFLKAAATSQEDARKFIGRHGGGDYDIGRRYLLKKREVDAKVNQRRSLGRAFVGGGNGRPAPKLGSM